MVGLLFFGTIFLWLGIAIYLAIKLPHWFNLRGLWGFAIAPMVFFAPVIDEVIALPQAYLLCQQAEDEFWYDPNAKGGVMRYYGISSYENRVVGFNIRVELKRKSEILRDTNLPVIRRTEVDFSAGFLQAPAFSSGRSMALLLPAECPSVHWAIKKYQSTVDLLGLTVEPRPDL